MEDDRLEFGLEEERKYPELLSMSEGNQQGRRLTVSPPSETHRRLVFETPV